MKSFTLYIGAAIAYLGGSLVSATIVHWGELSQDLTTVNLSIGIFLGLAAIGVWIDGVGKHISESLREK